MIVALLSFVNPRNLELRAPVFGLTGARTKVLPLRYLWNVASLQKSDERYSFTR